MSVKIKICGMKNKEDIKIASVADVLGFVVNVPESTRNITIEKAKKLIDQVPVFTKTAIVVTTTNINELSRMVSELRPDILQIHKELKKMEIMEIKEKIRDTKIVALLSISNNSKMLLEKARELKDCGCVDAILLDTKSKGSVGGTGMTHDWAISRSVRDGVYPFPVILAGGLGPENVLQAINIVNPYGIDISTGVEDEDGKKSKSKIDELIKEVKKVV